MCFSGQLLCCSSIFLIRTLRTGCPVFYLWAEKWKREGFEQEVQQGIQHGVKQGILEGIEIALVLKFGNTNEWTAKVILSQQKHKNGWKII
jgi:hypothetical protein